jgi:DnaK suppressor protein
MTFACYGPCGRGVEETICFANEEEQVLMDPDTCATYRQRLIEQQERLVQRIFELEEDLQHMSAREIEYVDRAQAQASGEMLSKLDEQGRREWDAIQEALARIVSGTYGDCTRCGKAIEPARLDAMPMARRCTHCQEVVERAGNAPEP